MVHRHEEMVPMPVVIADESHPLRHPFQPTNTGNSVYEQLSVPLTVPLLCLRGRLPKVRHAEPVSPPSAAVQPQLTPLSQLQLPHLGSRIATDDLACQATGETDPLPTLKLTPS